MQDVVHIFIEVPFPTEPLDELLHHCLCDPTLLWRRHVVALDWWLYVRWVNRLRVDRDLWQCCVNLGVHRVGLKLSRNWL